MKEGEIQPRSIWACKAEDGRFPRGSVEVDRVEGGRVHFFPNGGGFVGSLSLIRFLRQFRPPTKEEQEGSVHPAYFCFDDGPTIVAFTSGHLWNGWGCPLVTRDVLERYIAEDESGCADCFSIDDDGNCVCTAYSQDYDDVEPDVVSADELIYDGRLYRAYALGMGLCWNQLDFDVVESAKWDLGCWLDGIKNAIAPEGVKQPKIPMILRA